MSRSRRKKPFHAINGADSEKDDKRLYNRRYRRIFKLAVHIDVNREIWPHLREYSDDWGMAKDGKVRFDQQERPELLRK